MKTDSWHIRLLAGILVCTGYLIFAIPAVFAGAPATLNEFYETYPKLALVCPTYGMSPASAANVLAHVEGYATVLRQWGEVEVVKDTEFTCDESSATGALILGTERSNAFLARRKSELLAGLANGRMTLCGKSWNAKDLGAIFLNPFGSKIMAVVYLPDLGFIDHVSDVFHGPTGFVVFNHVAFGGNPQAFLARGDFSMSTQPWTIDPSSYAEQEPLDEMVVVRSISGNSPMAGGDILKTLHGKKIMASNFSFNLSQLDQEKRVSVSVLRAGRPVSLAISPKEFGRSEFIFLPASIPELPRSEIIDEFSRLRTIFREAYIDPFDLLASGAFPMGDEHSLCLPAGVTISLLNCYKALARFASSFSDGHAYIDTKGLRACVAAEVLLVNGKVFPFQPIISGARMFVPQNSLGIARGSEILAVNRRPAGEVLQKMSEYASGDTFAHRLSEFADEGFSDFYYLAFGAESRFQLDLKISGKKSGRSVVAVPLFSRENFASPMEREPVQEVASGLLLLRIDSFSGSDQYTKMLDSAFQKLRDGKIPNLAIDLRQNRGGSTDVLCELFSYLIPEEYRIYKICRVKRSKLAESHGSVFDPENTSCGAKASYKVTWTFPGGTNVYPGRIFVLVGPKTFSTAFDCAAMLRELRGAKLVGEAPGGKMIQSGDHFQMPVFKHGMTISVPYKDFLPNLKSLDGYETTKPDQILEPDCPVFETGDSIRLGIDPCLERVKDLMTQERHFRALHNDR